MVYHLGNGPGSESKSYNVQEEDEHKVLGDEGFEKSVDKVASIEKARGIYDLAQFTPKT